MFKFNESNEEMVAETDAKLDLADIEAGVQKYFKEDKILKNIEEPLFITSGDHIKEDAKDFGIDITDYLLDGYDRIGAWVLFNVKFEDTAEDQTFIGDPEEGPNKVDYNAPNAKPAIDDFNLAENLDELNKQLVTAFKKFKVETDKYIIRVSPSFLRNWGDEICFEGDFVVGDFVRFTDYVEAEEGEFPDAFADPTATGSSIDLTYILEGKGAVPLLVTEKV